MDLARKHSAGSSPVSMRTLCASELPSWRVALLTILVLLPLDQCFGFDIWQAPSGQPDQMLSQVLYDPNLTDPFYEVDEWSCPDGATSWATCRDGKPVVKNTARCYSTSFNVKHDVSFCEARLLDGHVIELLIHKESPAFDDELRVRIRDGEFSCQFWIVRDFNACTWTTTRQKLTLDRKVYGKGDVIKGRIDFECVSEFKQELAKKFGRSACTIKVNGVFKTILK